MFISHQNIYLIFAQRHVSANYKLDIVICSDYLSHIAILMFTSTPLCHVHQDYGIPYLIKLLRLLQQTPLNHYYIIIILDLIVS